MVRQLFYSHEIQRTLVVLQHISVGDCVEVF